MLIVASSSFCLRRFPFLHRDHAFLFNDHNLNFFRLDCLIGLVFLQIISQIGFGLLLIDVDLISGFFNLKVLIGFGHLRVGLEFGLLTGLMGLRTTDQSVAIGVCLSDDGISFHLGDARFSQGVQVAVVVTDIANSERVNAQAHVRQIARGHFLDFLREGRRGSL